MFVKETFISKEFAAPVPKTEDPFSDGLFLGKDGRYYIWTWDVGNVYRYLWKNDIENMISYIEKREYNEKCLTYISQAYSFSQFMHQVARYPEIYKAEELRDGNTPEIISHMSWYPIELICRKQPFLFVTKYEDGSYQIHGDLTVKYPWFNEIVEDIVERTGAGKEFFGLVVDVNELLESVMDIEHTLIHLR